MNYKVSAIAGLLVCAPALAGVVNHGGLNYETISWSGLSSESDSATGMAGSVGVTFDTMEISSESVTSSNFSSGSMESISFRGGLEGLSSLTFDQDVVSVLIFVGAPGDLTPQTLFGASVWDFDDALDVSIVASDYELGFGVSEGNIVNNAIGPIIQTGGMIEVSGDFNSIQWDQLTNGGSDQMLVSFAVATVPAPSAALALMLPGLIAGRRRR